MRHPLTTTFNIVTATFEQDSNIPSTAYGDNVEVVIMTHDIMGDSRSTTITIGRKMFTIDEIETILVNVKKHQKAVIAFNDNPCTPL